MKDSLFEVKSLIARMYKIDGRDVYTDMLNEDRASKQSDKARKVIKSVFGDAYNWNDEFEESGKSIINVFEEFLRQKIGIKSKSHPESKVSYEFEPGIARICYGELNLNPYNSNAYWKLIGGFKKVMEIISETCPEKYDENLNWCPFSHFFDEYKDIFKEFFVDYDNRIKNSLKNYKCGKYTINQIDTYVESMEYGVYFNSDEKNQWCITEAVNMFRSYSESYRNKIYFCLAEGFETIEPTKGEGYPYDKYGMSMICVIINSKGDPVAITLRWNHNVGSPGDKAFNLSKTIFTEETGIDFDSVFTPYTNDEIKILTGCEKETNGSITEDDYYSLLKNGVIPGDENDDFNNGFSIVYRHNESIYFDVDDGCWYYNDATDSPDFDWDKNSEDDCMEADLSVESYVYIIDKISRKIIGVTNNPEKTIANWGTGGFAFKGYDKTTKEHKLFLSATGKWVGGPICLIRNIYHYVLAVEASGAFRVYNMDTGKLVSEELFIRQDCLFYISKVYNNEKVLFLCRKDNAKLNEVEINLKDLLNMSSYFVIFNKGDRTILYLPESDKVHVFNCKYDELCKSVVLKGGREHFLCLKNSETGEFVNVMVNQDGTIDTSEKVKPKEDTELMRVLDKNRYIFRYTDGEFKGKCNIYDKANGKCEIDGNFVLSYSWDVFNGIIPAKIRDEYVLFNKQFTKIFDGGDYWPEVIFDNDRFCLVRFSDKNKCYTDTKIFSINDDKFLDCLVYDYDYIFGTGIVMVTLGGLREELFSLETGKILDRPDTVKDYKKWRLHRHSANTAKFYNDYESYIYGVDAGGYSNEPHAHYSFE